MNDRADQLLDEAVAEVEAEVGVATCVPAPAAPADPAAAPTPLIDDPPSPSQLGDFTLSTSEDRLEATITFPPLKGALRPDLRAVIASLKRDHKLVSIDEDALGQVMSDAIRSSDEPQSAVIARGTPAVDGEDGRLEWQGDFFESHLIVLPNGAVDHYHHTKTSVFEGQPIVSVRPPTRGTAGHDVFGKTIKPVEGKPAQIERDETVRTDPHDVHLLVAARPGMVEYARGKVTVSDVQIVEAVDFASGSIDFEGAVQVRNQVDPKFSVYAKGTVIIAGLVENARVESEKNIQIDKGVMGRGDALISSKGDLMMGFAREAAVHVGGRLVARRELLWCEGEVHGDLLCDGGRIVGGHWRVGGRLVADEIGSREEVATIVTLGEAPEQNRALTKLTRDRKDAQKQYDDFRRKYQPFLKGQAGQLSAPEREALEQRAFLLRRQASRTRKRELLVRRRMHIQRRSSFLWVKTQIHPGVRVRLNGGAYVHEFKEAWPGPVCVRYDAQQRTAQILHCALENCHVGQR